MPFLLFGLLVGVTILNRALHERAQRADAVHQRQIVERFRLERARMAAHENGRLQQSLTALAAVEAASTVSSLAHRARPLARPAPTHKTPHTTCLVRPCPDTNLPSR